jgi:hypothetical protein
MQDIAMATMAASPVGHSSPMATMVAPFDATIYYL